MYTIDLARCGIRQRWAQFWHCSKQLDEESCFLAGVHKVELIWVQSLQSSSIIVMVVILIAPGMTLSKAPGVVISSTIVSFPSPTTSDSMSSGNGCLPSVPENVTVTLKPPGTEKSAATPVSERKEKKLLILWCAGDPLLLYILLEA